MLRGGAAGARYTPSLVGKWGYFDADLVVLQPQIATLSRLKANAVVEAGHQIAAGAAFRSRDCALRADR